jgi:hypothetical protein
VSRIAAVLGVAVPAQLGHRRGLMHAAKSLTCRYQHCLLALLVDMCESSRRRRVDHAGEPSQGRQTWAAVCTSRRRTRDDHIPRSGFGQFRLIGAQHATVRIPMGTRRRARLVIRGSRQKTPRPARPAGLRQVATSAGSRRLAMGGRSQPLDKRGWS